MLRSVSLIFSLVVVSATKDGAGNGVSKSTYACSDPITGKTFLLKYFDVVTADDECSNDVCTCSDDDETWYIEQGRVALGTSELGSGVSPGFGLHLVNLEHRETTGGKTVEEIEAYFSKKLGSMTEYDAFMDYNIGLYTSSLDTLVSALESDSVDYLPITFDSDGTTWYSVMILVPSSHMVLEVFSESSTILAKRKDNLRKEPRLSSRAVARIREQPFYNITRSKASDSTTAVSAIRISRATADLDAISTFYTEIMDATLDIDYSADNVTRHCYLYSDATVDVCFVTRDDSATSSDFSVADMEDQMNAVHANLLANPTCGKDKWLDNHHAYDARSAFTANLDDYDYFYYCEPSMQSSGYQLHYIIDPTGWGIQLDMQISNAPSGCSATLLGAPGGNPACDLGSC